MPVAEDLKAGSPTGRMGAREISAPTAETAKAVDKIAAAERPMIIVGNGAKGQMDSVIALAEQIGAPIATTFKGKGLVSDSHPLGCGVLGRSGTPVASWFMNESDLILVFGASFANHTGIAEYKPIIQVDYDPMALGRFHAVETLLQGHIGETAKKLKDSLPTKLKSKDLSGEVTERRQIWHAEKASRIADDQSKGLGAALIMDSLSRLVDSEAVLTIDVGNNAYSFGRYFESTGSQDVLMSGYLGSIGFAFPAAMGAWAAVGDKRQIISISGDGGFGQYAMEMNTAVKYGMNITHIMLNNSELGKISKEQRAAHWDVWQTSLHNPNFAEFAQLCGAKGTQVTTQDTLDSAIAESLAHKGPALVEIITDPLLV